MEAQKHTRRVFLRMSAFAAAGVALALVPSRRYRRARRSDCRARRGDRSA
jgi:hypothetical protein